MQLPPLEKKLEEALQNAWIKYADAAKEHTENNLQTTGTSHPIVSVVSFTPPNELKNSVGGDLMIAYLSENKNMHRYYCERLIDSVVAKKQIPLFIIHTGVAFADNGGARVVGKRFKEREIVIMQTIIGRDEGQQWHRFWKGVPDGSGTYAFATWDGGDNKMNFIPTALLDILPLYCKPRKYIISSEEDREKITQNNKAMLEKYIPEMMQLPTDEVFPRSFAGIYLKTSRPGLFMSKGIEIGDFVGENAIYAGMLPYNLQLIAKKLKDKGKEPIAVVLTLIPEDSPFGKYTLICCYERETSTKIEIEVMELVNGQAVITSPSIAQLSLLPPEWSELFPKSYGQ